MQAAAAAVPDRAPRTGPASSMSPSDRARSVTVLDASRFTSTHGHWHGHYREIRARCKFPSAFTAADVFHPAVVRRVQLGAKLVDLLLMNASLGAHSHSRAACAASTAGPCRAESQRLVDAR